MHLRSFTLLSSLAALVAADCAIMTGDHLKFDQRETGDNEYGFWKATEPICNNILKGAGGLLCFQGESRIYRRVCHGVSTALEIENSGDKDNVHWDTKKDCSLGKDEECPTPCMCSAWGTTVND